MVLNLNVGPNCETELDFSYYYLYFSNKTPNINVKKMSCEANIVTLAATCCKRCMLRDFLRKIEGRFKNIHQVTALNYL